MSAHLPTAGAATPQRAMPQAALPSDGNSIVLPGQTPQGGHILSVLLKRSYDIIPGGTCTRAAEDKPLIPGDVFWDTPMNSAVKMETDFVPFKLATDVVLLGKVHAPGGRPAQNCSAVLQVGTQRKQLHVIGDRQVHFTGEGSAPRFGEPEPFTELDLRYERAYGGTDVYSDLSAPYPYPRNPLGRGFVIANTAAGLKQLKLPNFEDPTQLLTPETLCLREFKQWEKQPLPVGFAWYPKAWQPRALLAGILPGDRGTEQELRAAYAALLPPAQREAYLKHSLPDMDFRFFNGASAGFALPYLKGGEVVRTENLSPQGRIDFQLPPDTPRIGLDIGFGVEAPGVVLQTVQIRMEDRQVDMVWRTAVPYPGRDWLPQMRKMAVLIK